MSGTDPRWLVALAAAAVSACSGSAGPDSLPQPECDGGLVFADPQLLDIVKKALKLDDPHCLVPKDVVGFDQLFVGESIENLGGIEQLAWLNDLRLAPGSVSDLSPLVELEYLFQLSISGNSVSDLTPLASVTHLWRLDASYNEVEDLSPLVPDGACPILDYMLLWGNSLDCDEQAENIKKLEAKGVWIISDCDD